MAIIKVQGREVLVDDDFVGFLSHKEMFIDKDGYVNVKLSKESIIPLARLIVCTDDKMYVDHKNRNPLDNRKENLREATPSQNSANRKSRAGGSSKYKGVYKLKTKSKNKFGITKVYEYWAASIEKGNKKIHHKTFPIDKEIEAARWYDMKAKEFHGEFAFLNFPNE